MIFYVKKAQTFTPLMMMADYEKSNQIIQIFASKVTNVQARQDIHIFLQENVPFKAHVTCKISYFVLMSLSIKYKWLGSKYRGIKYSDYGTLTLLAQVLFQINRRYYYIHRLIKINVQMVQKGRFNSALMYIGTINLSRITTVQRSG